MRKHRFVAIAAIALLVLAAIVLGAGSAHVAYAHTQTPVVQMQSNNQHAGPDQETQDNGKEVNGTTNDPSDPGEKPGTAENQGQGQNQSGGGHQDQGQVDHQFEGTE